MPRLVKAAVAGLVFLLIMQIVVFAPQTVNVKSKTAAELLDTSAAQADVEQSMVGVHLFGIGAGQSRREWELWSDEALAFKGKNEWELKKVKVILFAENGVEFTVTGQQGWVETVTRDLKITGEVVTQSSNGYVFRTEEVKYSSENKQLTSPGEVSMLGPKDEKGARLDLRGVGLEANLTDSKIHIAKSVRAERDLPPKRHVVIRSEGAEFSGRERLARFLGNVVMDMENMRITGPEAEFEYDPKRELVKSISVKGGVKVSDTDKWATAQHLKVQFDEDRFVFKGNPRVVQDQDELRGEEIVFLDGGRKVSVQRARAKIDEKTMEKFN